MTEGLSKLSDSSLLNEFWNNHIFKAFIEMIEEDEVKDVVCRILEGIEELSSDIGQNLAASRMDDLVKKIIVLL